MGELLNISEKKLLQMNNLEMLSNIHEIPHLVFGRWLLSLVASVMLLPLKFAIKVPLNLYRSQQILDKRLYFPVIAKNLI